MFRTRIRSVRLKNGAELRLLPSAKQKTTERSWGKLHDALAHVRKAYADDLGGFVLVPWTYDGAFNVYLACNGLFPHANDLPHWLGEAIRREVAWRDVWHNLKS